MGVPGRPFLHYGMHSVSIMGLVGWLECMHGRDTEIHVDTSTSWISSHRHPVSSGRIESCFGPKVDTSDVSEATQRLGWVGRRNEDHAWPCPI